MSGMAARSKRKAPWAPFFVFSFAEGRSKNLFFVHTRWLLTPIWWRSLFSVLWISSACVASHMRAILFAGRLFTRSEDHEEGFFLAASKRFSNREESRSATYWDRL